MLIFGSIVSSSFVTVMRRVFGSVDTRIYTFNFQTIGYEVCLVYGFLFGFAAAATVLLKVLGIESPFIRVYSNHLERLSLRLLADRLRRRQHRNLDTV